MEPTELRPPLIVALAALVAESFPELGGRSIAVSEVDPFNNKTSVPTLPIAFAALVGEQAVQPENGGRTKLSSDVLLQFVFKPVKYTREDGAATPFFAFYDYEAIRDRLLTALNGWRTPAGGGLSYKSLDVTSDEFAVYIAFRFTATSIWCPTVVNKPVATLNQISAKTTVASLYCRKPIQEPVPDPCKK